MGAGGSRPDEFYDKANKDEINQTPVVSWINLLSAGFGRSRRRAQDPRFVHLLQCALIRLPGSRHFFPCVRLVRLFFLNGKIARAVADKIHPDHGIRSDHHACLH